MSIKYLPPGTRHGNKVYYARISVKGHRVEVSTDTADKRLAKRFAENFERDLWERHVLGGAEGTVSSAIDNYIAFRRPKKYDENFLLKIRGLIGKRKLSSLEQVDFDDCARLLYPGRSNETWNRNVYTPLQAALHHANVYLKIKRPKQKKPKHLDLTASQRDILIKNANDPDLKALLTLLFYNGPRITEAMKLDPAETDLPNAIACFDTTKTDEKHWRPLHSKVVVALANLPRRNDGRFFRWEMRSGPNKLIKALCEKTGIHFTPHMARHTFATLFLDKGGSLPDLMEAGGWKDERSALRYAGRDVERVRKAINRL